MGDFLLLHESSQLSTCMRHIAVEKETTLTSAIIVGMEGFEPPIFCPPDRRSTKLSHTPRTIERVSFATSSTSPSAFTRSTSGPFKLLSKPYRGPHLGRERILFQQISAYVSQEREQDLNLRPRGYEPPGLPDCPIPQSPQPESNRLLLITKEAPHHLGFAGNNHTKVSHVVVGS